MLASLRRGVPRLSLRGPARTQPRSTGGGDRRSQPDRARLGDGRRPQRLPDAGSSWCSASGLLLAGQRDARRQARAPRPRSTRPGCWRPSAGSGPGSTACRGRWPQASRRRGWRSALGIALGRGGRDQGVRGRAHPIVLAGTARRMRLALGLLIRLRGRRGDAIGRIRPQPPQHRPAGQIRDPGRIPNLTGLAAGASAARRPRMRYVLSLLLFAVDHRAGPIWTWRTAPLADGHAAGRSLGARRPR